MAKIPKNLSDKDMLQGYAEETSLESQFLAAEAAEDKKRRAKALGKPAKSISLSGLDDELIEQLGKKLLELKMELFRAGIKQYTMRIKREGNSIIITPVEKKGIIKKK